MGALATQCGAESSLVSLPLSRCRDIVEWFARLQRAKCIGLVGHWEFAFDTDRPAIAESSIRSALESALKSAVESTLEPARQSAGQSAL